MILQIAPTPGMSRITECQVAQQFPGRTPRAAAVRRVEHAAADDDFAARPGVRARLCGHRRRGRPAVLDQYPCRLRVGFDRQVRAAARRIKIGRRGAGAAAPVYRALKITGPVLLPSLKSSLAEVLLDRGGNPLLGDLKANRMVRHAQRAPTPWNAFAPFSCPRLS